MSQQPHHSTHQTTTGRTLAVVAAAIALLGTAAMVVSRPTTQAAAAAKPNIVLMLSDDQTLESLSKMPYTSTMRAVTFTNAFVNTPQCCPSRSTILTGQYSHHSGVGNNFQGSNLDESKTVASWLKSAGYRTGLVGKYLNLYPFGRGNYTPPGWDHFEAFTNGQSFYDYTLNENGVSRTYGSAPADYSTDVFKQKALNFIAASTSTQPFFLYFSPVGPHAPYTPAPRHVDAYKNSTVTRRSNFNESNVADKPAWVRALPSLSTAAQAEQDLNRRKSWEMLLSVDEAIKAIVQASPTNTMFVFMSDNGYSFGEHRWVGKQVAYDESIRVPLRISYPGIASRTETRLVSNIDLAPTFAAVGGATPTRVVDGKNLLPLITNTPTSWRTNLLIEFVGTGDPNNAAVTPYWGVRTKDHMYSELSTGEKELYVMGTDPYQLTNQANKSAYRTIQASLAAQLATLKQ